MEPRPATPDDAEPLAALVLAVAHHAYADLEPVRVDALDPDDEAEQWRDRLTDPGRLVRVASAGGRVVGGSCWHLGDPGGASRPGDARGSEPDDGGAVLTHLLVHPAAQNAGLGSALLRDAEAAAAGAGARAARTTLHPGAWWAASFLEHRGWSVQPGAHDDGERTWRRSL